MIHRQLGPKIHFLRGLSKRGVNRRSHVELDEPGSRRQPRFPWENRDVVEGQSCRNLGGVFPPPLPPPCNSLNCRFNAVIRVITEGTPNLDWRGFIRLFVSLRWGISSKQQLFDRGFYLSIGTISTYTGPPFEEEHTCTKNPFGRGTFSRSLSLSSSLLAFNNLIACLLSRDSWLTFVK